MKIAYLAKNIDHGSGGGRYALNVIKNVRALGHEVSIFKEEDDGHEGQAILRRGFGMFISALKLRSLVRDFDVVHALDVWPYGVHDYLAVVGTDKNLFISGVGTYSVLPLESPFKKLILEPVLKRAGKIFCISNYVKEEMSKRLPLNNLAVVHMGLSPLPKVLDEKRIHSSGPVLLTVGAIKHRKGQLDTVKSVSKLLQKYPDILYIMVGTTDERAYVNLIESYAKEHKMEKNIKIVGDAKGDEALATFYDKCDLFIMNSNNSHGHFEGFGLVFLEAESFGKPVVGSRDCGIEDALKDGYNGYLTKQADHEDIANKIDMALENKEILGRNSLEFVKNFSWEKMAAKYIAYYGNKS